MCLLFHVNGHPYFKGSSHTDYKQKPQLCDGTDLLRGFLSLSSRSGWGVPALSFPYSSWCRLVLFHFPLLNLRSVVPTPAPQHSLRSGLHTTLRKGCKPQFGGIQSHQGDTPLDVSVGSGEHFQRGLTEAG